MTDRDCLLQLSIFLVIINISLAIKAIPVKESDRLKASMLVLEKHSKELECEAEELKKRLAPIKEVYEEINGSYGSWGQKKELQRKIEMALLLEKDEELPSPVMADGIKAEWVISRVTPKRIYIRKKGNINEDYFDKVTGKPNYAWCTPLDVDATIAAWEEYKSASKAVAS